MTICKETVVWYTTRTWQAINLTVHFTLSLLSTLSGPGCKITFYLGKAISWTVGQEACRGQLVTVMRHLEAVSGQELQQSPLKSVKVCKFEHRKGARNEQQHTSQSQRGKMITPTGSAMAQI